MPWAGMNRPFGATETIFGVNFMQSTIRIESRSLNICQQVKIPAASCHLYLFPPPKVRGRMLCERTRSRAGAGVMRVSLIFVVIWLDTEELLPN